MKPSTVATDLFSSFAPATKEAWAKTARAEIEGKNPFVSLPWQQQGITGLPYYDKSDSGAEGFILPSSNEEFLGARTWYNMPLIKVLTEDEANTKALNRLTNGADGIVFDVQVKHNVSLQKLLKGIDWPICQIAFILDGNPEEFFAELENYLLEKKYKPESIRGFFHVKTYPHHPQSVHKVVHNLNSYANIKFIGVSSKAKDLSEQLSDLLVSAVTEVDSLKKAGVPEVRALRQVFFSIHAGHDFFLEIVRLKVLRILWYQVVKAYGIKNYNTADVPIHVITPAWQNDTFQPHENMLAGTTSGLSAVLGGCTSLSIEPSAYEERLERIALNVSNILREESHINKVADPTAGSYYLETMIKNLAESSWTSFTNKLQES